MSHPRTIADLGEMEQGLFFLVVFPALVAWIVFLSLVERDDLRDELDYLTGWCFGDFDRDCSSHPGGYY